MPKDPHSNPDYRRATDFLRGQSSKIFKDVTKNNKVVIVLRNSKPQNVIISYDEYLKLKKEKQSSTGRKGEHNET